VEHYFSATPDSKELTKEVTLTLRGETFSFLVVSGTFSSKKIDKGTLILAKSMLLRRTWTMLDVGCGVGVLGVIAGKFCKNVYLSDINERAVAYAVLNLKLNHIKGVVKHGAFYELFNKKFDSILLNPPQSAGKLICFKLIEDAKKHLKKKGCLQLVARRNKGGNTLEKKMKEVFGNVDVTAKESGYWVYVSKVL